jgi:hypothetical protein
MSASSRLAATSASAPERPRADTPTGYRRRVRRTWSAALLVVALAVSPAGCTQVVPGAGAPREPVVAVTPPTSRGGLVADPVADECLLDASEFGALVGRAVRPPRTSTVTRADGTTASSCVALAGSGPVGMINVYGVRDATPAERVRAAGRRLLDGVGEAAAVVDTATGPALQLATRTYLVTILVTDRKPSDAAWRTAATAALTRLPA